jgi:hypothetical protein
VSDPGDPPLRLGDRFRAIRLERFGPGGIDEFARRLGVPAQVWRNYEEVGELVPAPVLRAFLEITGADPLWLLRGDGPRYRNGHGPGPDGGAGRAPGG